MAGGGCGVRVQHAERAEPPRLSQDGLVAGRQADAVGAPGAAGPSGDGVRREGLGGDEAEPPPVDAPAAADVLARPEVRTLLEASVTTTSVSAYHTRPDQDYLRWRYASVPGFTYQAAAEGEGPDGALAIVRARQRGDAPRTAPV